MPVHAPQLIGMSLIQDRQIGRTAQDARCDDILARKGGARGDRLTAYRRRLEQVMVASAILCCGRYQWMVLRGCRRRSRITMEMMILPVSVRRLKQSMTGDRHPFGSYDKARLSL